MCDVYRDFNSATKYFLRDLIAAYPNIKEFKTLHMIYKLTKSINKKMPQKYLRDLLLDRYRSEILAEDESIFDIASLNDYDLPMPVRLLVNDLTNIKEIWMSLEKNDKDAIWKHLKVLIILSNKCD